MELSIISLKLATSLTFNVAVPVLQKAGEIVCEYFKSTAQASPRHKCYVMSSQHCFASYHPADQRVDPAT